MTPHVIFIPFIFALGACIGSFLNVVVWRLPRGESLVNPPSHCPKCNKRLRWYDNLPVIGWIKLGGRCRDCRQPISPRYPIIEALTGLLFVFYYVMFFIVQDGPCPATRRLAGPIELDIRQHWPIFGLYLFALASLFSASLIDLEQFWIPQSIPMLMAGVGVVFHALAGRPAMPGSINVVHPVAGAMALGGAIGLAASLALKWKKLLPASFEKGWPLMEHEREEMKKEIEALKREGKEAPELPPVWSRKQVNAEMRKEMAFLMPPMALAMAAGLMVMRFGAVRAAWAQAMTWDWLTGLLGALLGAMVGAFVVWLTRILGTLAFGREAMGMGDVDLMFGVGAIVGGGAATVAFFVAPFFGLLIALYTLLAGKRRELPYGPYLSLGVAFVMLYYCPIAAYLRPGLSAIAALLTGQSAAAFN